MLWRLGKVFPCAHAGDSSPDLSLRYMARTDFFYHLYVARHIGNLQWVGSFFSTPSECSLRLYETFTSFVNNFLAWLKAMRIFLGGSRHSLLAALIVRDLQHPLHLGLYCWSILFHAFACFSSI